MSDYKPRVGDRVRVALEGEVGEVAGGGFEVAGNFINPDANHVVSIEKIEPPVEVFKPGDVVRNRFSGATYTISKSGSVAHRDGEYSSYLDLFTSTYYEKVDL